jgi:hypothetical protein
MISIASTLIHPGGQAEAHPASVSPIMSFMSSVRMTLASVSSSEGNCLSKRKAEREESVLRSRGKNWCCNKSMS